MAYDPSTYGTDPNTFAPGGNLRMLDENGRPIDITGGLDTSGLPGGAQTAVQTPDNPQGPGDTTPPAPPDTGTPGTDTTPPPPRVPRHGGTIDPATGNLTVGQPTGGPPAPAPVPGNTLDDLMAELIKSEQSRNASAQSQRDAFTSRLNTLLDAASKPVSMTDPQIAGPTNAFFAQGQRARALLQEKLAQEAAVGGAPTGEVERGVNQSFSDLGNATGSYAGGLVNNELAARRDELKSMMNLGASYLTADQTQALQERLAAIESQMNNQHFYDTLSSNLGSQANSLDTLLAQWMKNAA